MPKLPRLFLNSLYSPGRLYLPQVLKRELQGCFTRLDLVSGAILNSNELPARRQQVRRSSSQPSLREVVSLVVNSSVEEPREETLCIVCLLLKGPHTQPTSDSGFTCPYLTCPDYWHAPEQPQLFQRDLWKQVKIFVKIHNNPNRSIG